MKYVFLISVFIGLLLQNCSQWLIFMEYKVNRDYIAKVLCVNRNKPEMHCNGKCHLKKQLEKDASQQNSSTAGKEKYEVIYADELQTFNLQPVAPFSIISVYYQDPVLHTPFFSFFHPPQA